VRHLNGNRHREPFGAELRQPLGITIIGGLMLSQVLTLYTQPVVYLYLGRLGQVFRGRARSFPVQQKPPTKVQPEVIGHRKRPYAAE
jgi:hypothetical protein